MMICSRCYVPGVKMWRYDQGWLWALDDVLGGPYPVVQLQIGVGEHNANEFIPYSVFEDRVKELRR